MHPVFFIVIIAGGEAEHFVAGTDTEAEHGPVGIIEIGSHLVDFQYLAVGEAGIAEQIHIVFVNGVGQEGEFFGVSQPGVIFSLKYFGIMAALQNGVDFVGTGVVLEQTFEAVEMVLYAVVAFIEQADKDADGFEVPLGQGVVEVVQHVFVQSHVAGEGVWSQAVGQ